MKIRTLLCVACVCLMSTAAIALAETKDKAAKPAAMDPKAMQDMMAKAAAMGPQHDALKKLVGEWNCSVKSWMDPSQPPTETKSTSVVTAVMDGRYVQENVTGEMMGQPFTGMQLTGYDTIQKKYVSTWVDNFGTGIMMSEGTGDASGSTINWTGESSDPMTGKKVKYRMVSKMAGDNQRTFEMYSAGPGGKEAKMMEITYDRKM